MLIKEQGKLLFTYIFINNSRFIKTRLYVYFSKYVIIFLYFVPLGQLPLPGKSIKYWK